VSEQLISRSPDLQRLRSEGYSVAVIGGHLVVRDVPYVNSTRQVLTGTLVSTLNVAADVTVRPDTHVALFSGEIPCDQHGSPLAKIYNGANRQIIVEGKLEVDHMFSSKPSEGYSDYYEKMVSYVQILSAPATVIEPDSTAARFAVVEAESEESVFVYPDTASSRAGIQAITQKLAVDKVAIVGLGGTGGYVLDLIAKTPIRQIHLFDGDRFLQHNAFRAPGAASIEHLSGAPMKVDHYAKQYAAMRRHIVPHASYIDESNVTDLQNMDFVFLCVDSGTARKLLVNALEQAGVSFIDVGMGVGEVDGRLDGICRVTTSTPEQRTHVHDRARIPFGDSADAEYSQNIQIADLNALNAALAVIRWKRLVGFYNDQEHEYFSAYTIDGNHLVNEERL
jgi:hypothetical protein